MLQNRVGTDGVPRIPFLRESAAPNHALELTQNEVDESSIVGYARYVYNCIVGNVGHPYVGAVET